MKTFSNIITEAQDIKLSRDWDITWTDWHAPIARDFLRKMDERASALNITKELAEKAVREFWMCNFPAALKTIWKQKVHSTKESANGGTKEVYTYAIKGYGTFTETYERSMNSFSHKIEFTPENVEDACYDLTNVMTCFVSRKGAGDFNMAVRQAEENAFKLRSNHILNCLFVGFSGRDLGVTLSCVKRKNKIQL